MRAPLLLLLAACTHPSPAATPLSQRASPSSWPTSDQVPALTRLFYNSLGVIHATSDEPDASDTPLLASLQPCQIEPARPLDHPGLQKFFPGLRFFASSCGDGSYAVVSIDKDRHVRLVSLEPHERLPANAWDEATNGSIVIGNLDDVRLFASAFGALMYLQTVPPADVVVHEGTRSYEARAPKFEVTLDSDDGRHYSVASNERD